jgi:hypothetical protein
LIPLLAAMGPRNPTLVSIHDQMLPVWRSAGLEPDLAPRAQCALHGFLTGSSIWDAHRPGAGETSPLDSSAVDGDQDFEFGLDVLIQGLRARLVSPAAS